MACPIKPQTLESSSANLGFKARGRVVPKPVAAAFDGTVVPLLAQIRANLHPSRTLRDTLLPKLLRWEL